MKVIKRKNLPTKFPLFQTLITAIALDYWNAPQWLWGCFRFSISYYLGIGLYQLLPRRRSRRI